MGQSSKWIQVIDICLSSVSFQILIIGECSYVLTLSRGFRQGDPFSFYLFLFCADELSNLLRKTESSHLLSSLKVARSATTIF